MPPKALTRVSVSIPQRKTGRERQVQIFDSQPLPSPSSVSCPNSPARLSYISRVASAQSANAALPSASLSSMNVMRRKSTSKLALSSGHFHSGASTPDTSESSGSGSSGSASRYDSVLVSSSLARSLSNDTPSTSINSLTSGMGKLALAQSLKGKEKALAPCTCTCGDQTFTEAGDEPDFKPMPPQARPAPGPSLLSQTAPQNLTPQRSASTCSQHPHSPDILPAPLLDAVFEAPAPLPPPLPINIKIADLGNATPTTKHYTEDIQTRQYRAPEAIIGRTDWGATADIWSVACVVFELLTAEYLFDPQGQGDLFGKDDDHIAQIIELLGDFGETKVGGRFSRELFDSTGERRTRIRRGLHALYICATKTGFGRCDAAPLLTVHSQLGYLIGGGACVDCPRSSAPYRRCDRTGDDTDRPRNTEALCLPFSAVETWRPVSSFVLRACGGWVISNTY